ncbi:MAG: c-type cytochrome biogenesis protein CcmI [bacterium]
MFYFICLLLALLAAVFVCWPLLNRRGVVAEVSHDEVVKDVYRQRYDELPVETADPQLRGEIADELGAVLLTESLGDVDQTEISKQKTGLSWFLGALVPLAAVGVYLLVAEPELHEIRGAEEVLTLAADDAALQNWVARLSAHTENSPDDEKSFYLLGHAYLKQGSYAAAAEAFGRTAQLAGEDLNVQVYWLQARFLAAEGVLDDFSRGLAQRILQQEPSLGLVLEILALDAFRMGDAEQAITLLNRALTGASDLQRQASFATAIRQVREGLQTIKPGVSIAVSASSPPSPRASVFVVARPVGGGMPFAAVKQPAFLLPFEVRLDDLVSMSSERKLSQAEEFEVLVRISESGNAMPQAGDWQWVSQPLKLAEIGTEILDATLTAPE